MQQVNRVAQEIPSPVFVTNVMAQNAPTLAWVEVRDSFVHVMMERGAQRVC